MPYAKSSVTNRSTLVGNTAFGQGSFRQASSPARTSRPALAALERRLDAFAQLLRSDLLTAGPPNHLGNHQLHLRLV